MKLEDWSEGVIPNALAQAVPHTPEQMPTAYLPLRDSPENARGYREVDIIYSCVPDSAYPWDADKVKAIQEVIPDAVPMWVQWVFLRPNSKEKVVFGRHALGRCIKEPGREHLPFRCAMPTMPCNGLTFERPNRIWFIHEGDRNRDYPDIPGTFLPFDDTIVHRAKESARYMKMSEREYRAAMEKELITDVHDERARRRESLMDDLDARDKDFHSYADKVLEQISDVERAEYLGSVGKRSRATKPMVFHGADYPR
jgi:hypothetical protein